MSQWWYSLVTEKDEDEPPTRKATAMTKFAHTIDSGTNLVGFVYQGTYETPLGENISCIPYSKRDAYQDDVAKMYLDDILAPAIEDMLPSDIDDYFTLTYVDTYHPRFYNFETDSIEFTFSFGDEVKDFMEKYAKENKEIWNRYLCEHFTSRDGFYSYVPNNYEEWHEGFVDDDSRCVSVLLGWMLTDDANYDYSFYEGCDEIATDYGYIPYEYAVMFHNGYVGYCVEDYDYDEEQDRFRAYLFDSDGNLENTVEVYDPWNEYRNSAFAAWDWTLERDVTNHYEHVGYGSDEMDIDEFHKLFDSKIED